MERQRLGRGMHGRVHVAQERRVRRHRDLLQRAALRRRGARGDGPGPQDEPGLRAQRVHLHARPGPDGNDQPRRRAGQGGRRDAVQPGADDRSAGPRGPGGSGLRREQLGRHHLRRLGRRLPPRWRRRRRDLGQRGRGRRDPGRHAPGQRPPEPHVPARRLRPAVRRRRQLPAGDGLRDRRRPDGLDAAVEPGRHPALRCRLEPVACQPPHRQPAGRVPAVRRVRPAARDPVRRHGLRLGLRRLYAERAHLHRQPVGQPLPVPVLPQLRQERRPRHTAGLHQPRPERDLPRDGDPQVRRQRRDLRRPGQRLARRRHQHERRPAGQPAVVDPVERAQGHPLRRLGQRPAQRGRRPVERLPEHGQQRHLPAVRRDLAQRHPGYAPELRGPRLRRRRPRHPDR